MQHDEAILALRADPARADLIRDAYLDADAAEAARRFTASEEFAEARALLGPGLDGAIALDLGAGNGIASFGLASNGARAVLAIDPDTSDVAGLGALATATAGMPVDPIEAVGEALPLSTGSVDLVYARQVLHHATDLVMMVEECARVLRPDGVMLACREHVVDDDEQLQRFLASHPIHQLAGGEHAYRLSEYLAAFQASGLLVERTVSPWGGVINAFPEARDRVELTRLPRSRLQSRLGRSGSFIGHVPGVPGLVKKVLEDRGAGRLYSFLVRKPG